MCLDLNDDNKRPRNAVLQFHLTSLVYHPAQESEKKIECVLCLVRILTLDHRRNGIAHSDVERVLILVQFG